MDRKIKCVVRYDGTDFSGWQVQPDRRTVQGTLQDALSTVAGQAIDIAGAGRTDAGVHALGQVFSCEWPSTVPLERLRRSLSKMLAPEIRVESAEEAAPDFHAGYSAKGKRYLYSVCTSPEPDPFARGYAWCFPWEIDRAEFQSLANMAVGEHDFAGFRGSRASSKTTVRTIHSIEVRPGGVVGPLDREDMWHVEFYGTGFLYKMVRNLMGSLVDIARGRLSKEQIVEQLNSPGPYQGSTAPAGGLFMAEVLYD